MTLTAASDILTDDTPNIRFSSELPGDALPGESEPGELRRWPIMAAGRILLTQNPNERFGSRDEKAETTEN